jgi:competence CoiA-like predicted nuclease
MKFGRTKEGERISADIAKKGNEFFCPCCNAPLILKQGEINDWHFAHEGGSDCDAFTESKMSEWHIKHQEEFPEDCREVRLECDGVVHIADVKIGNVIIEFQHSPMSNEVFEERCKFYSKFGFLVWVFDFRDQWEKQQISWIQKQVGHDYGYFSWKNSSKMLGQYDFKESSVYLFIELDRTGWGCLVNWNPSYMKYFSGKRLSHDGLMSFLSDLKSSDVYSSFSITENKAIREEKENNERMRRAELEHNRRVAAEREQLEQREAAEKQARERAKKMIDRLTPELQKVELEYDWVLNLQRELQPVVEQKRNELNRYRQMLGW